MQILQLVITTTWRIETLLLGPIRRHQYGNGARTRLSLSPCFVINYHHMVIWYINLRHNFLKAKLDLWIIFAWLKYNAALMLNGYTNRHLEVGDHYGLGPLDQLDLTQQKIGLSWFLGFIQFYFVSIWLIWVRYEI